MTDAVVVLCTCETELQAKHIAENLVRSRLAACVNIVPGLQSIYRWQDKLETAHEILLLVKTTRERFPALRDRVKELHAYDTPEIIALPVSDGSADYLSWLREQV